MREYNKKQKSQLSRSIDNCNSQYGQLKKITDNRHKFPIQEQIIKNNNFPLRKELHYNTLFSHLCANQKVLQGQWNWYFESPALRDSADIFKCNHSSPLGNFHLTKNRSSFKNDNDHITINTISGIQYDCFPDKTTNGKGELISCDANISDFAKSARNDFYTEITDFETATEIENIPDNIIQFIYTSPAYWTKSILTRWNKKCVELRNNIIETDNHIKELERELKIKTDIVNKPENDSDFFQKLGKVRAKNRIKEIEKEITSQETIYKALITQFNIERFGLDFSDFW